MFSSSKIGSHLSTSLQNLNVLKDDEDITFKDKIKRTFSSIKRRTRNRKSTEQKPPSSRVLKPLRSVQSVPGTPFPLR